MNATKQRILKVLTHPAMIAFGIFCLIFGFYFLYQALASLTAGSGYIKVLYWVMILAIIFTFVILLAFKKISLKCVPLFLLLFAIALRLIYSNNNGIFTHQHDVGKSYEEGHYGYAVIFFRTWNLPSTNSNQFYQPPLNAIIQGIGMHIASWFFPCPDAIRPAYEAMFGNTATIQGNEALVSYIDTLYSFTRVFSCFYSCMTVYLCHLILKEMDIDIKKHILILSFVAVQPVLVMMSGTMNNDNLSYMFFFLALLFAVKWYYKPTYLGSISLALSIGLGMLSKLSIGFIAIIVGPLMIVRIVKEIQAKNTKSIVFKTLLFALIVFPLGLSYSIRNLVLFHQPITYIWDVGRGSWLHQNIKDRSFVERFLSLPFSQLFHQKYGIFHDYTEYNIWVDLFKTSVFEEFSYGQVVYPFAAILLIVNIIICFAILPALVYCLVRVFKKKEQGKPALFLILCAAMLVLGLASYISLTVTMPYSCSSNFRYVSYLAFAGIGLYVFASEAIPVKGIRVASMSLLALYEAMSVLFVLIL